MGGAFALWCDLFRSSDPNKCGHEPYFTVEGTTESDRKKQQNTTLIYQELPQVPG